MNERLARVRVVLVEPGHPGNIGAAARAMKTMGLCQLCLVRPRRFPDPQALWRAAGAKDLLNSAWVVESFAEAIADCVFVVGTTARDRRMSWRRLSPGEAATEVLQKARRGTVALVFGREADGLTNDELDRCHLHVNIPASESYTSLNLAMAVQILCYELRIATLEQQTKASVDEPWDRPPASLAEVEKLLSHCERLIQALDFLPSEHHSMVMRRIRRLLSRIEPDVTEVSMLRGLLSAVEKQLQK